MDTLRRMAPDRVKCVLVVGIALAAAASMTALAQSGLRLEPALRGYAGDNIVGQNADPAWAASGNAFTLAPNSTSTGLKLRLGYQVNPYIALEGRYTDFTAAAPGDPLPLAPRAAPYANSWNIVGVGSVPVYQGLRITGKLGLSYARPFDTIDPTRYPLDSGTSLAWGAGFAYDFTPNLGLRGNIERLGESSDSLVGGIGHPRQGVISGALRYRF